MTTSGAPVGLLLGGLVLTLLAGCGGTVTTAGSSGRTDAQRASAATAAASGTPTTSAEPPRLSPARTLADALDRLEATDLVAYDHVLEQAHTAAVHAYGVFEPAGGRVSTTVRYQDPGHRMRPAVLDSFVLDGRGAFVSSSQVGPSMQGCWWEASREDLNEGRGAFTSSLGVGTLDLLRSVRVTGMDRVSLQVHGRLPLARALRVLTPGVSAEVAALPHQPRGSAPIEVTVVDGQVRGWELNGWDVVSALGTGPRILALPSAMRISNAVLEVELAEPDPSGAVRRPAESDVVTDLATGCHGRSA